MSPDQPVTSLAHCHCGAVTISVSAPLFLINMCHCKACQRRTGAQFGSIVWVPEAAVTRDGETRGYARPTDEGRFFTSHFCVACGSNIVFKAQKNRG